MRMKIKELQLVLENSEIFYVPSEYLIYMVAEDIKDDMVCRKNHISKSKICNSFLMEIDKEANKEENMNKEEEHFDKQFPFERIVGARDLAQVHIIYENDETEWFYTKWTGAKSFSNDSQTEMIGKDGNLYIVCNENITVEERFRNKIKV